MINDIKITQHSVNTVNANAGEEIQVLIPCKPPQGYKTVGIIRAWIGAASMLTFNAYMSSGDTVTIQAINISDDAISGIYAYVTVMFIRQQNSN